MNQTLHKGLFEQNKKLQLELLSVRKENESLKAENEILKKILADSTLESPLIQEAN